MRHVHFTPPSPPLFQVGTLRELMSPLIYTVDANAFELFSRADGRLRTLDRMLTPSELVLADKVCGAFVSLRKHR